MNDFTFKTLAIGVIIGLIASFILIIAHKYEIHHRWPGFCFFCAGFWISVLLAVVMFATRDITVGQLILVPIIGSVVAHKMQA